MSGIVGTVNIRNSDLENEDDLITNKYINTDISIEKRSIPKFEKDKIFFETKDYVFALEGVILNKDELMMASKKTNWKETLIDLIEINNTIFFENFRGSFSGVIYFKLNNNISVFTDQIASKQIYYYENNGKILFSSEIKYLIDLMKKNNISYKLDKKGAYSLLTHGYMIDDLTLFQEIKHLKAGCYLKISNNKLIVSRYHLFKSNTNYKMTEDQIIEKIDDLFNIAVEKIVRKNNEYSYKNYAQLSAGLDSRMATWVLSKKVKDITNITYSQSNYFDEVIPKKISAELKTNLIFKPLDNGLSLFFIDEIFEKTAGLVLYGGPAQVWDMLRFLDLKKVGIIHTGMLANVLTGTYLEKFNNNQSNIISSGAYSTKLINEFEKSLANYNIEKHENQEIFTFYNRGFNGMNMGSPLIIQEYTESYSPFSDLDFFTFCLTIPIEMRSNNNIYDKWILKKYPDASKYAHNGRKITKNKRKVYTLLGKTFTLNTLLIKTYKYLMKKVGISKNAFATKHHMNPFDYWYNENNDLKEYMDSYYRDAIFKIEDISLKNDMIRMYEDGSTGEKTQVLTLLSVYKNYFKDKEISG